MPPKASKQPVAWDFEGCPGLINVEVVFDQAFRLQLGELKPWTWLAANSLHKVKFFSDISDVDHLPEETALLSFWDSSFTPHQANTGLAQISKVRGHPACLKVRSAALVASPRQQGMRGTSPGHPAQPPLGISWEKTCQHRPI